MRKLLFLIVLILLLSGCKDSFIISKFEITGVKHADKEKIIHILKQLKGKNLIFSLNKDILREIKNIDFVKTVEYEKIMPNIMKIKITELNILGYCTYKKTDYLVLENGNFVPSHEKTGIKFKFNNENYKDIKNYINYLNTKWEIIKGIKSITIGENYNILQLNDGFILKIDKNLRGLKNMKYENIIRKHMHDKIKGLDLRFDNMAILILED